MLSSSTFAAGPLPEPELAGTYQLYLDSRTPGPTLRVEQRDELGTRFQLVVDPGSRGERAYACVTFRKRRIVTRNRRESFRLDCALTYPAWERADAAESYWSWDRGGETGALELGDFRAAWVKLPEE